jgi:urea transporter
MTVWFWKVLDNPVVEQCIVPATILAVLVTAYVLLPGGSGLEGFAGFNAVLVGVLLVCRLVKALS